MEMNSSGNRKQKKTGNSFLIWRKNEFLRICEEGMIKYELKNFNSFLVLDAMEQLKKIIIQEEKPNRKTTNESDSVPVIIIDDNDDDEVKSPETFQSKKPSKTKAKYLKKLNQKKRKSNRLRNSARCDSKTQDEDVEVSVQTNELEGDLMNERITSNLLKTTPYITLCQAKHDNDLITVLPGMLAK